MILLWRTREWAARLANWTVTVRRHGRRRAGHCRAVAAVTRGVAAGLAARPAAPRRRLVPAHDRRLPGRPGRHGPVAAGRARRPVPRLAGRRGTRSASAPPCSAFALCAPVAVPAGLLSPRGCGRARIYRIETGLSGQTATAPVIFDARQWRRQARTARARNTAPGTVPLTDRRGPDRDRRDHPRRRPPLAARPHHPARPRWAGIRSSSASSGQREDEPDDPDLGRLVRRRPHAAARMARPGRCWS